MNDFPDNIDTENNKDWYVKEIEVDTGYSIEKKIVGIIPKKLLFVITDSEATFGCGVRLSDNENNNELKNNKKNIPTVIFSEIGALNDTISIIREIIELPIKQPQIFKHLGIKPHKGILFYGPPGCGKTLIAKAIANEIQAHFRDIKGPELMNKYVGQSEANLREVFNDAHKLEPSIIFFDEIDSIAYERSNETNVQHQSQFVNQLLTLMDGVEEYSGVRIIASTNRPDLIDKALLRPGRFDYHIEIKKPTREGCKEIVKIYTKNMPLTDDVDLDCGIFLKCEFYGEKTS